MRLISGILNHTAKTYSECISARRYGVGFYNFWSQNTFDMWLYQFIESKGMLPRALEKRLSFYSVFGPRPKMLLGRGKVNVFFTAENVQSGPNRRYRDHARAYNMDLCIGFEHLTYENYFRFPLWMMVACKPSASEKDIRITCKQLSHPPTGTREKFASLVARHDTSGLRRAIFQEISQIGKVDCDGILMHNNDDLKLQYHDNKTEYLRSYRFNICPENSNTYGYVTEKLLDAIAAGCIPLYWGSDNNPEPDVFNHDAILFWRSGQNNDELLNMVRELYTSDRRYMAFSQQPRLLPHASDYIVEAFRGLEQRFRELLT